MYNQKPLLGTLINWAHPLSKGLVGAWLFNEGSGLKTFDLSGKNHYGILHNNPIWIGGNLDFETDSNQYIELDTAISLADDTQWTIIFKLNFESLNANRGLYGNLYTSGNYTRCFYDIAPTPGIAIANDANISTIISTGTLTINTDYTLAIVCNGSNSSNIELFINGISKGTATLADSSQTIKRLATYGAASGNLMDGLMEYFYIYGGVALLPSQISQLYTNPYCWLAQPMEAELMYVAPPVGAIMNQFQRTNLGADLYDGVLIT